MADENKERSTGEEEYQTITNSHGTKVGVLLVFCKNDLGSVHIE